MGNITNALRILSGLILGFSNYFTSQFPILVVTLTVFHESCNFMIHQTSGTVEWRADVKKFNKTQCYLKDGEMFDYLSDYQLLMRYSAVRS
jgi:hypothetical protein